MNYEDDLFDSINNLSANAYTAGCIEGEKNGKKAALFEGFKTGLRISIGINSELGYYYGVCENFTKLNQPVSSPSSSELKSFNLSCQIRDIISKIDISNPHNDVLINDLNQIRDKFKQFCSLTNFKSDFKGKSIFNAAKETDAAVSLKIQAMRFTF
jgi:hypothetical protein